MRSHRLPRSLTSSLFRVLLIALLLTACGTALADDGKKVVGGYFEEWSIYFANFNIAQFAS